MAAHPYQPAPIDTSGVALPHGVARVVDALARNTHEVWARERIADGWRPGPVRDDARREHPGLVPWAELPEIERRYDRTIVTETLKALYALGFTIVVPGAGRGDP